MATRLTLLILVLSASPALAGNVETCLAEGVLTTWVEATLATCEGAECATNTDDVLRSDCEASELGCAILPSTIIPSRRPAGPQCIEDGPLCTPDAPGMSHSVRTNVVLVFPELPHPTYRASTWPTAGLPEYVNHYADWLREPTGPPPRA